MLFGTAISLTAVTLMHMHMQKSIILEDREKLREAKHLAASFREHMANKKFLQKQIIRESIVSTRRKKKNLSAEIFYSP